MLPDDVKLVSKDIQALSSCKSVVDFFTRLGYTTTTHTEPPLESVYVETESLHSVVKHAECVSSDADRMFEVYLFEVRHLTIAVRNEITQAFRTSLGDYLLVLTHDYERLDFVLVEHYTSTFTVQDEVIQQVPLIANRSDNARPRVLPVHPLNPSDAELGMLSRFTYTEIDAASQYQKLLSAYVAATWSEAFFNNRGLFSDHYLTKRVPDRKEWKSASEIAARRKASHTLRTLYEHGQEKYEKQSELVLRLHLLEPILSELGFKVTPGEAEGKRTVEPHYRLYPSSTTDADYPDPLALCMVYPWGRNLDGKDKARDPQNPDENPGAVVMTLLDADEADWVIVTNGKSWRLYAAGAHSRATNYYEFDLWGMQKMTTSRREEAFPYFWLLFRATAFIPAERKDESEEQPICFLDELLIESDLYARALGERLEDRVFEEIFMQFAYGFIAHAQQEGILPQNMETMSEKERDRELTQIFMGTLTFLYRLLFLLYAESRDLLPVRQEGGYYEHSLQKLKQQIAEDAGTEEKMVVNRMKNKNEVYSERNTSFYEDLQTLFCAIDRGKPSINVPAYDGGLFLTKPEPEDLSLEATSARFLAEHKIPNYHLALGLDRMARDVDEKLAHADKQETKKQAHPLIFIDYKSLGVRHLGSIYEGLLEFKLQTATEEMVVVGGKHAEEVVTRSEARDKNLHIITELSNGQRREKSYSTGTIYLENERRERKATGSYYTPDYIVKYIVEQTIGPTLKEKLKALRPVFRQAQKALEEQRKQAESLQNAEIDPEYETYKRFETTLNEAFFDFRVLDPAMGSGHFLVEAVDYITDQMAESLNEYTSWNPIAYELEQTRNKIERNMQKQGVTIDVDKLTILNLLKRRVLKSCIYGVDLNPMAVELTKVSLWLNCFTLGAPLSFLDPHVKCGNSLFGAYVQPVQKSFSESLYGFEFTSIFDAAQIMSAANKLLDATEQEVTESRTVYREASEKLEPYRRLFNVWLSEDFGNKHAKQTAIGYRESIMLHRLVHINKSDRAAIDTAQLLAQEKHFFHWEVEFPNVFLDKTQRKENGGFDAVIGNPPYFSISSTLSTQDTSYLKRGYRDIYTGNSDILYYFLCLVPRLLKRGCRQGMIVSRYFQEAKYAEPLRSYLSRVTHLEQLVDFQNFQVFGKKINVLASIIILHAPANQEQMEVRVMRLTDQKPTQQTLVKALSTKDTRVFDTFACDPPKGGDIWNFQHLADAELSQKFWLKALRLDTIATVVQSMQTGLNEVLTLNTTTSKEYSIEPELLHPIAKAGSISRYEFEQLDRAIIWTQGIDINEYPHTKRYLLQFREALAARYDIKSRKANWWEMSTPRNAELFFGNRPRILVPFIATGNKFCVDDEKRLNDGGDIRGIFIKTESQYSVFYLCAILNSKVCEHYHLRKTKLKRGGYYEYFEGQLSALPIRRITFDTPEEERATCLEEAKGLYEYCLGREEDNFQHALDFINHYLSKDSEASDVVHDFLAYLAWEMIWRNKEKRKIQTEFLEYLAVALRLVTTKDGSKSGIDVLSNRNRITEYAGDYQRGKPELEPEALWDILVKNQNALDISLDEEGLKDQVLETYQISLNRVVQLREELRRTDELIDQIIYRLYGLTKEESDIIQTERKVS